MSSVNFSYKKKFKENAERFDKETANIIPNDIDVEIPKGFTDEKISKKILRGNWMPQMVCQRDCQVKCRKKCQNICREYF